MHTQLHEQQQALAHQHTVMQQHHAHMATLLAAVQLQQQQYTLTWQDAGASLTETVALAGPLVHAAVGTIPHAAMCLASAVAHVESRAQGVLLTCLRALDQHQQRLDKVVGVVRKVTGHVQRVQGATEGAVVECRAAQVQRDQALEVGVITWCIGCRWVDGG